MNTQNKFLTTIAFAALMASNSVLAEQIDRAQTNYDQNTPTYNDPTTAAPDYSSRAAQYAAPAPIQPNQQEQQSVAKESTDVQDHSIRDEVLGFAPQIGSISYTNPDGAYNARAVVGITGSFNFTPLVASPGNRDWYVGVTSGALYSHNGSGSSNFFGANSSVVSTDNSNMLIIPADLKIGYNMGERFRLSAHGGGNLIYRSAADSVNLGVGSSSSDSLWKLFPNVGADMEWQVSERVSILLRPDMTLTPGGNDILNATIGATFVAL